MIETNTLNNQNKAKYDEITLSDNRVAPAEIVKPKKVGTPTNEEAEKVEVSEKRQFQNYQTHTPLKSGNIELQQLKVNNNEERIPVNKKRNIGLELTWNNITMIAKKEEGSFMGEKTITEKKILNDVSGNLHTGNTLAIMGASGAGKTTLLNFLSRKIVSSTLTSTGEVTLNGKTMEDEDFQAISSYVMQDDMLDSTMTPIETLIFTAQLRMKGSRSEIEERVQHIIKLLRIEKCKNTKIGDSINRGVSGGERKRVSIAVELLSDLPIIFLDEPTTGLDSFNAYEVVNTLNDLSKNNGKMIIFTIHQPASEIFGLIDKLCIMALGRVCYFGERASVFQYFDQARLPIPINYNPFEHFIEVTNLSIVKEEYVLDAYPQLKEKEDIHDRYEYLVDQMAELYNKNYLSEPEKKYTEITSEISNLIEDKKIPFSTFDQTMLLFLRLILISRRNQKVLVARMFQNIILGTVIALVWANSPTDKTGLRDRLGYYIMVLMMCVIGTTSQTMLVFAEDRGVFLRERASFLYSPLAYFISKILVNIALVLVTIPALGTITYYSVNLNDLYGYNFWVFQGILILITIGAVAYSFFLGSMVKDSQALASLNIVSS